MYNWTYKNHFKCGFIERTDNGVNSNLFYSEIGTPERPLESGLQEAIRAAKLIYNEAHSIGQDVVLCLSGGVDSEAMLWSFIAAEVNFKCIFMRFENDLNDYDLVDNVELCKKLGVEFSYYDVNIRDFYESEKYYQYGQKYRCQSPQLAAHLHLINAIKGYPVLAGNPLEIYAIDKNIVHNIPGDLHCTYLRFFVQNNRAGAPYFFLYTPELCYSFLHGEIMQELLYFARLGADVNFFYELKCLIYRDAGFNIKPRSDKFTGFEKLRKLYDKLDNSTHGQAFDLRFRAPLVQLNPLPTEHLQIVNSDFTYNQELQEKIQKRLSDKQLIQNESEKLPSMAKKNPINSKYQRRLIEIYNNAQIGVLLRPKNIAPTKEILVKAEAWAYTQIESKLWLCRELENLAKIHFSKPVSIWLLAAWYGQLSFLLLSREQLLINEIIAFDQDSESVNIATQLHHQWVQNNKFKTEVRNINELDYSENCPDIVINTACEHFENDDWFRQIKKGCWFVLQSNNLKVDDHPSCFRSVNDFENSIRNAGASEIFFSGTKNFYNDSPFQRYMIIGKK